MIDLQLWDLELLFIGWKKFFFLVFCLFDILTVLFASRMAQLRNRSISFRPTFERCFALCMDKIKLLIKIFLVWLYWGIHTQKILGGRNCYEWLVIGMVDIVIVNATPLHYWRLYRLYEVILKESLLLREVAIWLYNWLNFFLHIWPLIVISK